MVRSVHKRLSQEIMSVVVTKWGRGTKRHVVWDMGYEFIVSAVTSMSDI